MTRTTDTRGPTVSRTVTDMSGRGQARMSGGTRTATTGRSQLVCRTLGKHSLLFLSIIRLMCVAAGAAQLIFHNS